MKYPAIHAPSLGTRFATPLGEEEKKAGGAEASPHLHLAQCGHHLRSRCAGLNRDPAGRECAPLAALLTLSLVLSVSWSPPAASPSRGGGVTTPPGPGPPPRCLSSNITRSRVAVAASSSSPETRAACGVRPAGCPATPQPRTGSPAEPRPLTPSYHGTTPRRVTPKTASTSERSRPPL